MTPEEVKKTQETIEKLRRLAAPNSGATEHERTAAKTKAETLEAKIKSFTTSGTQHREWTGRVKTQSTTGTGRYNGKSKADFKEEFEAYQKAERENFKDSMKSPEKESRTFLSAMEMNKIYFYQCETGIYFIEQMTVEFLNEQIASISRKIRELEMEAFPELNNYAINSHKVMKDRLKMVRDRKVAKDVGGRRWRM